MIANDNIIIVTDAGKYYHSSTKFSKSKKFLSNRFTCKNIKRRFIPSLPNLEVEEVSEELGLSEDILASETRSTRGIMSGFGYRRKRNIAAQLSKNSSFNSSEDQHDSFDSAFDSSELPNTPTSKFLVNKSMSSKSSTNSMNVGQR